MAGTLFVVATPIGNLEDLSFRALRVLKEVDAIAAEDTRRTAKLLAHYAIRKSMVSLHEHNERRETPRLIARLSTGDSIALVSDAGTPGIADPGQLLVRAARDAGIRVTPIPGPSALMAALSATGIAADRFVFLGFIPRSGSERERWIEEVRRTDKPVAFFEAPHRIRRTLEQLRLTLVNRPIHIHRELSKINEEYVKQPSLEYNVDVAELGEFVLVVEPAERNNIARNIDEQTAMTAGDMIDCLTNNKSIDSDTAERLAAEALSVDRRSLKNAVKKARIKKRRREDSVS